MLCWLKGIIRRCAFLLIVLQFFVMPSLKAGSVTFSSGSYIIPMDTTYQDNGMWSAFGLIYNLLENGIPVHWAIIQPKTSYGEVDFTVPSAIDLRTSAAIPANYGYAGGPFVIDSSNAAAAHILITAWWAGGTGHSPVVNQPVVHQATSSFTAEVDIVLNRAPVIALENDASFGTIPVGYMNTAGIPASTGSPPYTSGWSLINEGTTTTPGTIAGGGLFQSGSVCQQRIFDVYVTPHNDGFVYSLTDPTNVGTICYGQLDNFVYLGGGWIALCFSVQTNEDSMADLTINGNTAVKALFKTNPSNAGGFLLQGASKPYQTPSPTNATCANAAFPAPATANAGTNWVPVTSSLGLPVIQGVFPAVTPILTSGVVSSWTAPPTDQPTGITPTNYPNYWNATERISYYDTNPTGSTERYDSILDGVYHNGTGAGKVSFFGGHSFTLTLPYSTNNEAPFLRAFYNALFLNGNGAVKLQIDLSSTACLGQDIALTVVNAGSSTATLDSNIVLTLSSDFSYLSTNAPYPPPDIISGQTLTWLSSTIPTINAGSTAISINVLTSPSTPLGSNQIATLTAQYSDPFGYEYTVNNCTAVTVATVTTATITSTNPQTICDSTPSTTISGNTPNTGIGETGLWTQVSGPSGVGITSPSSSTTTVTGLTGANVGSTGSNVYVFAWTISSSGGFCTSSAQTTVTVYQTPAQPSAITGPASVCSGIAYTYSVTNNPIATSYTWTLPSGWTGTSTTNSITATPTSSAVSGTVSVIANNNTCASTPQTLAVTVTTTQAQPSAITGSTTVCSGTAYTYSVTNNPSATSYTWTLPSGWTGTSTTNSITATPTGSAVSGTISVTANNNTCASLPQTLAVTVTITPAQPSTITGPAAVCSGTTYTYSVTNNPSATSYTWTLPSGWTGTSTTNSITATPTGSAVSGNISVTANNNTCASTPQTLAVTVTITPAQPSTIIGSAAVCSGIEYTYSVTNDPSATSYTWTLPSGWTGTSTTNSITATPTGSAVSGTISVIANNNTCASLPQTLAVTVTITPAQPSAITGPAAVCSGTDYTYSVTNDPSATNYTWTLPSGWTGTSTTNSITATPTSSSVSGTISVTASNNTCTSTPQTLAVTVTITPADSGAITGSSAPCSDVSTTYSIAPIAGTTGYTWTVPLGWTITAGQGTETITVIPTSTSGSITVTPVNGACDGNPASLLITPVQTPSAAGSITGSTSPCSGSSTSYSITPVVGASFYTWTVPSGWIIISGQGSDSIITTPSTTTGFVTVTPSNGSCSGASSTTSLITPISSPDAAGPITGSTSPCSGISTIYSIDPVANATSYVWTVPSGWTITGGQGTDSITVIPSTVSGYLSVTPLNGSCNGASSTSALVTPTQSPGDAGTITGSVSPCSAVSTSYSIIAVNGATSYVWTVPTGWTIMSGQGTTVISVVPSISSGSIIVTPTDGSCAGAPALLSVTPVQTPDGAGPITGVSSPCSGVSTNYSISPIANATGYLWDVPNGWIITSGQGTNAITVTPSTTSGLVTVTPTNSSCSGNSTSLPVTPVANPVSAGSISGSQIPCAGNSTVYSISPVANATNYTWIVPSGWTIVSGQGSTIITVIPSLTNGSIIVTPSNGLCNGSPATLTVSPVQSPAAAGPISGSSSPCSGVSTIYSISPVSGAISYSWAVPSGWTITAGQGTDAITVTPSLTSGSVTLIPTNGSCSGSSGSITVNPIPNPSDAGSITGSISPCTGVPTIYSITPVANTTTYTWTVPLGWTITSGQGTNSITTIPSTTSGPVTVTPTNGLCTGALATTDTVVPVQTPAAAGPITGSTSPCSGTSTNYSINSVSGATAYMWGVPTGWAITAGQGTEAITVIPSLAIGSVTVTPTNGSCNGTTATSGLVTPAQSPDTAGAISGASSPCSGITTVYSIIPVAGATSYTWIVPSGWIITMGQGTSSISVIPSATAGTITVTPINGSCNGNSSISGLISPVQLPSDAGAISGPISPCSGASVNYSVVPVSGATGYTWTVPAGWVITGGQGTDTITVTPSSTAGSISVTPTNGSCNGNLSTQPVNPGITPNPAGIINGSTTPCVGSVTTYFIAAVSNATSYIWTVPTGWTITMGQGTNSIIVVPSTNSGFVTVTPANEACIGTSASTALVTPVETPGNVGSISGSSTVCTGVPSTFSIAPVAGATSYTWTVPGGWTGLSNQPQTDTSITVTPSANGGTITVTPNNGTCIGTQALFPVSVTAVPVIGPISGSAEVCYGSTNIYYTTMVPGISYEWLLPSGWTIIGSSNGYAITAVTSGVSGNVSVIGNSLNGVCSSAPQTITVTVNPLPTVAVNPPAITINSGSSTILTASGADTYLWSPGGQTGSSITVSPLLTTTYTVTGTDVNGCTNTASSTVTVVNSIIVANPDSGSLQDGAAGGIIVANVLANDTLNGSMANLSTVQLTPITPFNPYVTLNPDGSVSVVPGTPAGVYTIGYKICELTNLNNCSSTTVQAIVGAAPIVANPNSGTVANGANGGTAVLNVLANDTLNGVTPNLSNVNLTLTGAPNPYINLNSNGSVSAIPGTPAGVYVIGYKICEVINPTNCSSTTVTVTVNPPPIVANPDLGIIANGTVGGVAIPNLLVNDTLNGVTPTTSNVTITSSSPLNSNVIINSNGSVSVPPGTPEGIYTAGYTICEIINPTNCSSSTVQVNVGAASIVANPDSGSANGAIGGMAISSVLANDTLNGVEATLSTVTLTSTSPTSPYVTLNPNGSVSLAPGTPAGVYSIGYMICQILNPANCSSTTVQVTAIPSTIVANPNFGNVSNGTNGGVSVTNVLANDTLNGVMPTLLNVTLTATSPASPYVTLNQDGSVAVALNTPVGVYTIGYQICEILNPTNCSSTTVQTTVGAAPIIANPNSGNVPDGATGGIAVQNVLSNDTLNGITPTLAEVNLTPTSPFNPYVILNVDGSVSVAPGTPAGVYTIGYKICQKLNPINCSSTDVQVTVGSAPIIANPNSGTVSNGMAGGIAVSNVLVNDTVNGQPATLLNVNLSVVGNPSPYLALDPNTGAVLVLPGTPEGVYILEYQICDKQNPTSCSSATVTVTVSNLLPQPPIDPTICQIKQQFIGGVDIIDVLKWTPPTSGPTIVTYRIYQNAALTELIGEVANVTTGCDTITFRVHQRKKGQANTYYIVSVDAAGQISIPTQVSIGG